VGLKMENSCVEDGMKLARWLERLGMGGASAARASAEDYERLAKEAGNALADVAKMKCLSENEKIAIQGELGYLKKSAEEKNFLYTSDAGHRLLNLLSNPQGYLAIYGKVEKQ